MTTDEIMARADALSQAAYNLATPDHYDHEARDEARATLLAAVEQLTKDAGRYRWLRDVPHIYRDHRNVYSALVEGFTATEIESAIDAAMQPIQPIDTSR